MIYIKIMLNLLVIFFPIHLLHLNSSILVKIIGMSVLEFLQVKKQIRCIPSRMLEFISGLAASGLDSIPFAYNCKQGVLVIFFFLVWEKWVCHNLHSRQAL